MPEDPPLAPVIEAIAQPPPAMPVTLPATIPWVSTWIFTVAVDFATWLEDMETITDQLVTVTDLNNNQPYAPGLIGEPEVTDSTKVAQTIGNLRPKHKYRVTFTATISAVKQPATHLDLEVPF